MTQNQHFLYLKEIRKSKNEKVRIVFHFNEIINSHKMWESTEILRLIYQLIQYSWQEIIFRNNNKKKIAKNEIITKCPYFQNV